MNLKIKMRNLSDVNGALSVLRDNEVDENVCLKSIVRILKARKKELLVGRACEILAPLNKVWISTDKWSTCSDVWTDIPILFDNGVFNAAPLDGKIWIDGSGTHSDNDVFKTIQMQVGTPPEGEMWEVELIDGTFEY